MRKKNWKRTGPNLDRARHAEAALRVYVDQCFLSESQRQIEFQQGYMVSDLICDALHLAARRGHDVDCVLKRAINHFGVERTGETGEN